MNHMHVRNQIKQNNQLLIIGIFLGFLSGLSFFVFKVMERGNNPKQLKVSRIHHEWQNN